MCEEDRLRVLQMRAPRHDRFGMRLGLRDDRIDEAQDVTGDRARMIEQVHPHEGGDLIVAASSGAQLAAELGTHGTQERRLESAVDILIAGARTQRAVLDAARQRVETFVHRPLFVGGEVARRGERLRVRVGARDVVQREAPVEVGGATQCREFGRRPGGESRAPQCALVGAFALRVAHRSSLSARDVAP